MDNALISIVITAHNMQRYILDSVSSVLSQKGGSFECIVIDDESDDDTFHVLKVFQKEVKDSRLQVIRIPHRGVSGARNEGIRRAKGTYVLFVDGDDMLSPDALSVCENAIKKHEDPDVVFLGMDMMSHDMSTLLQKTVLPDIYFKDSGELADWYIIHKTLLLYSVFKLYKKEVMESYAIRFDESVSYGEDRLFNFAFLSHCKGIVSVSECIYKHRSGRATSLTGEFRAGRVTQLLKLHEKKIAFLFEAAKNVPEDVKKSFEEENRRGTLMRAVEHIARHEEELGDSELLSETRMILKEVRNTF